MFECVCCHVMKGALIVIIVALVFVADCIPPQIYHMKPSFALENLYIQCCIPAQTEHGTS